MTVGFNLGDGSDDASDAVWENRDAIDAGLYKKRGKLGMVARPLSADADRDRAALVRIMRCVDELLDAARDRLVALVKQVGQAI